MKADKRSFYALQMSVEPGGARMWDIFVQTDLNEIRVLLNDALTSSDTVNLLAWYGMNLELITFYAGKEVQRQNLLPHIRVRVEGYPPIWFDESGVRHGVKFDNQSMDEGYAENPDPEIEHQSWKEALKADKFSAVMDWGVVCVPPLEGNPAQRGDRLRVDQQWVGFGTNDVESGEYDDENLRESISQNDEEEDEDDNEQQ